jgi:lipoprotein-anchoring transpeptidase ErfK/SrfK
MVAPMPLSFLRSLTLCAGLGLLGACAAPEDGVTRNAPAIYGQLVDGDITIPAVDTAYLATPNRRTEVAYSGPEAPGTIVVDPFARSSSTSWRTRAGRRAIPIAVGREGRGFRGSATVQRKEMWPGWAPTANMLRTEPEIYGPFARGIPGGVASPLGARSLYLYRGGRDTRYRIHGTNDLESIGNATTAGCIRLFNQDIIDLFDRTPMGARVVVLSYEEAAASPDAQWLDRGMELPPRIVDPALVYAAVEAAE